MDLNEREIFFTIKNFFLTFVEQAFNWNLKRVCYNSPCSLGLQLIGGHGDEINEIS